MSKVFHLELNGLHSYYTTLTALCDLNQLDVSKFTLDRHNFKEPFIKGSMIIRKSVLQSGLKKVTQVKNDIQVKTSPVIEKPKLNILDGTYIKKGNEYFFNMDGTILNESEFLKLGYKRPTKILGNISDLDRKK